MQSSGQQRVKVDQCLDHEPRERYSTRHPAMECFAERVGKAWRAGLFEGSDCSDKPVPKRIVQEQARIAYEEYGLVYDKVKETWIRPDGKPHPEGEKSGERSGRVPMWFRNFYTSSPNRTPGKMEKLDLLLIGEIFKLPLETWALAKEPEDVFDRHIHAAKTGINLLACGFDFIITNSGHGEIKLNGRRIKIEMKPERKMTKYTIPPDNILKDARVLIKVPLPQAFNRSQVFLLEQDADDDVSLISPSMIVEHDPWFEGEEAIIPRSEQPLGFGTVGKCELIALITGEGETLIHAAEINAEEAYPILKFKDFEKLKYKLLTIDPDQWCVHQSSFEVIEEPAEKPA
jgi:hypothetical protein